MQPDPVDSDYPDPIENPNLLIEGGGRGGNRRSDPDPPIADGAWTLTVFTGLACSLSWFT